MYIIWILLQDGSTSIIAHCWGNAAFRACEMARDLCKTFLCWHSWSVLLAPWSQELHFSLTGRHDVREV
jgi:hypothetical protein